MKLTCYRLGPDPCEIVPGEPDRAWMDEYESRNPYRCLPLVIANTSGWEVLCPYAFSATWNGGPDMQDLTLQPGPGVPLATLRKYVLSHFANGVLTMHTGYLFRTEPGWDLLVSGPPNRMKHGMQPLVGIVETSWLPFPFTMNWRFTAPGTVSFEKGEPFCMVMPIQHDAVDNTDPIVKDIADDPELKAQWHAWNVSRADFIKGLHQRRPDIVSQSWQRHYFKGQLPSGEPGADDHINRRRLKKPRPAEAGE